MNINEITGGQNGAQSISLNTVSSAPATRVVSPSQQAGIASDSVDTSLFGKLMQHGAHELQNYLAPRPDVITQFSGQAQGAPPTTDDVINTVLARMVGA